MVSNIITIMFAGIDTSRHTTKACLYYLSTMSQVREKVVEAVNNLKEDSSDLKFENCNTLIHFINEALRLKNPLGAFITRIVTKNFKLGKYKIFKGDMLSIPMAAIHRRKEFFENEDTFDIDRHRDEIAKKRSKHAFCLLVQGRRNCLGKYLAMLVVKIIVGRFVENFEFKEVESHIEPQWEARVSYGLKDCRVMLKSV